MAGAVEAYALYEEQWGWQSKGRRRAGSGEPSCYPSKHGLEKRNRESLKLLGQEGDIPAAGLGGRVSSSRMRHSQDREAGNRAEGKGPMRDGEAGSSLPFGGSQILIRLRKARRGGNSAGTEKPPTPGARVMIQC